MALLSKLSEPKHNNFDGFAEPHLWWLAPPSCTSMPYNHCIHFSTILGHTKLFSSDRVPKYVVGHETYEICIGARN